MLQVVLCIFCISNSFLTLVRAFSFAFGGLRAAIQVHNTLLNKIIDAPVQFFDQTPAGRILNRLELDAILWSNYWCFSDLQTSTCFYAFQVLFRSLYNRWFSSFHYQYSPSQFCWPVGNSYSIVVCAGSHKIFHFGIICCVNFFSFPFHQLKTIFLTGPILVQVLFLLLLLPFWFIYSKLQVYVWFQDCQGLKFKL